MALTPTVFDRPAYATATAAADGANATLVTFTLRNMNGSPRPGEFEIRLSDNASGVGLATATASGNVTDKTPGTTGQLLDTQVAKKALRVQTTAAGTYQLSITDTGKAEVVLVAVVDGKTQPVLTLSEDDYGS
jgi:hypothetical protein